ncbi:hypothetical protein [Pseudonocardia sp.]|uniref:hypothetical protein n=1 Tax=Pseudonocardia sp. TaxID=60912 RepID=UPI0026208858|nr:hypothetical protein [Pseudonocardia sp.]
MPITDDDHGGYVAGRYRDGSLSDAWTDVLRCAPGTFVRFVPRCACGWTGRERPATPAASTACMQEWFVSHVVPLPTREPARDALMRA